MQTSTQRIFHTTETIRTSAKVFMRRINAGKADSVFESYSVESAENGYLCVSEPERSFFASDSDCGF